MPELPEVETFRRSILEGAEGKRIVDAQVDGIRILPESVPDLAEKIIGKRIIGSHRNGKTLFLELDDGYWLLLHFAMSGVPMFYEHEAPRFARFTLIYEDVRLAICWQRRLGAIALLEDPWSYLAAKKRGPDALDVGLDDFCKRMKGRRAIKTLLLDQSFVAGIGNLYADEMLFQQGLRPDRKADTLDVEEVQGLHGYMRNILQLSIDMKTDFDSFPDGMMLKSRSKTSSCPKCEEDWTILTVGGRTSYFCRSCQR